MRFTSSNTANATVPASITVPAGQTSANFTLTGVAAGSSTIAATASGYQAANLPVTVATVTISVMAHRLAAVSQIAQCRAKSPSGARRRNAGLIDSAE